MLVKAVLNRAAALPLEHAPGHESFPEFVPVHEVMVPEPKSVSESAPVNEFVHSEPAPVHEPDTKPTLEVSSDHVIPFEYCLVSTLVNSATPVTNAKSVCLVS